MNRHIRAAFTFVFVCGSAINAKLSFLTPPENENGTYDTTNEKFSVLETLDGFLGTNTVDFLEESPYIPVISLNHEISVGDFNPCDETTFASKLSFNMTLNLSDGESITTTRWAAAIYEYSVWYRCPTNLVIDLKYHMLAAKVAQELGASALIYVTNYGIASSQHSPPGVDAAGRIVDGTLITIPTIVQQGSSEDISLLFSREVEIDQLGQLLPGTWESPYLGQVWLKSASLADMDANWIDELKEPFSFFIITNWVGIAWVSYLIYIIISGIKDQYAVTREKKGDIASKRVATMRYLILAPELAKCVASIYSGIDPSNFLKVLPGNNFFIATIVGQGLGAIGNFTDVSMCFYCYEIYCVFVSAEKMQKNTSLFEKYKWITPCIIGAASLVVIGRMYFLWLFLYGDQTGYQISILYTLLSNLIIGGYLTCLSCKTVKLVKEANTYRAKKLEQKLKKSGAANATREQAAVDRTSKIITMNRYMALSSTGMFFTVASFVSFSTGFLFENSFAFTISTMMNLVSNALTSSFQIFAATLMIPKTSKTEVLHMNRTMLAVKEKLNPHSSSVVNTLTGSSSMGLTSV